MCSFVDQYSTSRLTDSQNPTQTKTTIKTETKTTIKTELFVMGGGVMCIYIFIYLRL